ncbi:hypothetical protein [Mariniblastus fucicola]|uniref:Lipoprotein SmpA/OmlA domain-containing protein n=1 Tax=Mariniblastus fucicola TaxID=980251 RepID=A0A5B9P8T2_9BACT|nr:hypothetical protein [Mariniblastus fucicola]QEG22708.1 hypothetical protein MFFC18_25910 [Mariniblastus fucicola]
MNPSRILSLLAFIFLLGYTAILYVSNSGGVKLLNAIRDIKPGFDRTQVEEVMGEQPNVFDAVSPPAWNEKLAGVRESGQYWHYFMGFPPRNLVIYVNTDGKVVFATWDPT